MAGYLSGKQGPRLRSGSRDFLKGLVQFAPSAPLHYPCKPGLTSWPPDHNIPAFNESQARQCDGPSAQCTCAHFTPEAHERMGPAEDLGKEAQSRMEAGKCTRTLPAPACSGTLTLGPVRKGLRGPCSAPGSTEPKGRLQSGVQTPPKLGDGTQEQ